MFCLMPGYYSKPVFSRPTGPALGVARPSLFLSPTLSALPTSLGLVMFSSATGLHAGRVPTSAVSPHSRTWHLGWPLTAQSASLLKSAARALLCTRPFGAALVELYSSCEHLRICPHLLSLPPTYAR